MLLSASSGAALSLTIAVVDFEENLHHLMSFLFLGDGSRFVAVLRVCPAALFCICV